MFDLSNKVALVTGASRGLGWAMAESLARCGAHVVLNARDATALDQRVASLQKQGLSGEAAAFDVTDSAAAGRCVDDIVARHGQIDILVANAGINRLLCTPQGFTLVGWSDTGHLDAASLDETADGAAGFELDAPAAPAARAPPAGRRGSRASTRSAPSGRCGTPGH